MSKDNRYAHNTDHGYKEPAKVGCVVSSVCGQAFLSPALLVPLEILISCISYSHS